MARLGKILIFLCFLTVVHSGSIRENYHDTAKQEVEKYIENKKAEINPRYRLQYHVSPPVGWMNDPNGFSYYNGEFHLFYQFYPYDSIWGPMHWGHVSSPDLVNWKQLPVALIPDNEMCFSGSAVVDGDTLTLIYTGREVTDEDPFFKEGQFLAFSDDGIDFHKYVHNPVLPSNESLSADFRDPKVWKHGDTWYVVIGSKTADERGKVVLYSSEDLRSWRYLSVIAESDGKMGYMWECPDFFELDGKFILLMSPQGIEPEGDRYKNTHQTGYIIGSFSYDTNEFVPEVEFQELDFGHDFYATQTTEHDGKRYMVGWFGMWDVPHPEDVDGWAGALTLIRELRLVGNRLTMKPVDEILNLRSTTLTKGAFASKEQINLPKATELIINFDLAEDMELLLGGTEGGDTVLLRWDTGSGKVVVERDDDVRQVEWTPIDSKSWRLFLDASSLELFCGEGEVVFSSRVYPHGDWTLINLNNRSLDIEAFELNRAVPN